MKRRASCIPILFALIAGCERSEEQEPVGGEQPAVNVAEFRSPAYQETRELMSLVSDGKTLVEADGEGACAAFKEEGSRWLDGEKYLFILDLDGMEVCHPANPELEGTNILDLTDADGRPLIRHLLQAVAGEKRDGWTHYQWPKPGENTPTWKTTYGMRVQGSDGREYVVASGLYGMRMERMFVADLVDRAVDLIRSEGMDAFDELRDKTSPYRFGDTYVFIIDEQGTEIVNPAQPMLEGQNLWDLQDADGMFVNREIVRLLETNEAGWVDYLWPKPGDAEPSRKSSYVRKMELDGQTLIVGSGLYFD